MRVVEFLLSTQSSALSRIARGDHPAEIVANICRRFESEVPGTVAGVTMLNRTLQSFEGGIFPSLSADFGEALSGIEVAGCIGSCALAVYKGETVVCEDIAADSRFAVQWKELALAQGLKALISIPAASADGVVLGTFVVGYAPDSPPDEQTRRLAGEFATLCGHVLAYRNNQLNQELLIGELQHRVRNLFSTIGAVVYATLKTYPEPESFRRTFDGRLMALARAHAMALESAEADLRQLLIDTLAPYSIDHEIRIEGPQLLLSPQAAVAFSLAAHELATNAAKYGALSKLGGSVAIGWDFEDSPQGDARFALTWRETGGPSVRPPERQGYGQKTLSRSLSAAFDGKVELDFLPDGLSCSIVAPHTPRLGARLS